MSETPRPDVPPSDARLDDDAPHRDPEVDGGADVVSTSRRSLDAARRLLSSNVLDPDDVREVEIAMGQVGADQANGEDPTDSTDRLDALVDRLSGPRVAPAPSASSQDPGVRPTGTGYVPGTQRSDAGVGRGDHGERTEPDT